VFSIAAKSSTALSFFWPFKLIPAKPPKKRYEYTRQLIELINSIWVQGTWDPVDSF